MAHAYATWSVIGMSSIAILLMLSSKLSLRWHFASSILLIVISGTMVWMMLNLGFVLEHGKHVTVLQFNDIETEKFAANFWLLVFPAIFGSIGVNMLSNYLQPPKD